VYFDAVSETLCLAMQSPDEPVGSDREHDFVLSRAPQKRNAVDLCQRIDDKAVAILAFASCTRLYWMFCSQYGEGPHRFCSVGNFHTATRTVDREGRNVAA